jgi:hypothetical protein
MRISCNKQHRSSRDAIAHPQRTRRQGRHAGTPAELSAEQLRFAGLVQGERQGQLVVYRLRGHVGALLTQAPFHADRIGDRREAPTNSPPCRSALASPGVRRLAGATIHVRPAGAHANRA